MYNNKHTLNSVLHEETKKVANNCFSPVIQYLCGIYAALYKENPVV